MSNEMKALEKRLRDHALPDSNDEREVLHAPLLVEAADAIANLLAKREKPCARVFEHKFMDPVCVEFGCQSLKIGSMSAETAKKILGDAIKPDGSLNMWNEGEGLTADWFDYGGKAYPGE